MKYINLIIINLLLSFIIFSCTTISENQSNNYRPTIDFPIKRQTHQIDTAQLPEKVISHIINASVFEQQKNYSNAIIEYQLALRIYQSSYIYYLIAKNYLELDYSEQALENVIQSIELDSSNTEAFKLLADIYVQNLQFDNALQVYQYLNKIEPTTTNRIYLARLYENRNVDTAIAIYRSIAHEQEDIFVISRLVRLYEEKNDTTNLLTFSKKLFKLIPNSEISRSIIRQLIQLNDYAEITETIETTLEQISPDNAYFSFYSVLEFFLDDTVERSKEYIPKLLQLSNKHYFFDWRISLLSGYLAGKINDSISFDSFFSRCLNLADSIADLPVQIGLYYLSNNNFIKASDIFLKYSKKFPQDHRFYFYGGVSLSLLDKLKEALPILEKALELKPMEVNVLIQLAIVYDRLGDVTNSDKLYEEILAIQPLNSLANNNYAYSLCIRNKQLDRALKMSRIAIEANPESAAYLDTYGWIHYQMGDYKTALEYITKAVTFNDASAEVFEHLGDIYIKINEPQKALDAWRKALELEPERESIIERIKSIK